MAAESLTPVKGKQMEDYEHTKPHRVHLELRGSAEPRKSHFTQTQRNMTEVSIKAACFGKGRAPIFLRSHLSPLAPLCYILMDSVGNPCGTDYIVEGSGFDRLQISTTARQQRLPKWRSQQIGSHSLCFGQKVLC